MPFCISTLTPNSLPYISSINPKRTLRNQTVRSSFSSSFPSISTKSITMSMHTKFDLFTYWTSLISEINLQLDQATLVKYPQQIYESMCYSVLTTEANRATPVMCIASCELFGGSRLASFPTVCALETVHLIEGIIDQVEGKVHVSWVQPRVLCVARAKALRDMLEDWLDKVHTALLSVEADTPDLGAS